MQIILFCYFFIQKFEKIMGKTGNFNQKGKLLANSLTLMFLHVPNFLLFEHICVVEPDIGTTI